MRKRSGKARPKSKIQKRDANQLAHDLVRILEERDEEQERPKNPAAVALGRLGGLKGGPARVAKMTDSQLSASGRKAALARWHPKG